MNLSEVGGVKKSLVSIGARNAEPRWVPVSQIPKKIRRGMLRNAKQQKKKKRVLGGGVGSDDSFPFKPQPNKPLEMRWGKDALRRPRLGREFVAGSKAVADPKVTRAFAREARRRPGGSLSLPTRTSQSQPPRGLLVHKPKADAAALRPSASGQRLSSADVVNHERRHLSQPLPKKGRGLTVGARDQLKVDRAADRGFRGSFARTNQLVQRSEAWADAGTKMTSGHVFESRPKEALTYARTRRRMSTAINGRPDKSPVIAGTPSRVRRGKNKNKLVPTGTRRMTLPVEAKFSREGSTGRQRRESAKLGRKLKERGYDYGRKSRRSEILRGEPGWFKAGTPVTRRRGRDQVRPGAPLKSVGKAV